MSLLNLHDYVRLALSHAVFVPNDDGSWTVEITVLPGCVTWGKTRAEAALMAEDAAEGWLLTALQFGDEIPVIDGFALNQVLTTGTQETTMVYESKLGAGGDLMLREASAYFAGAAGSYRPHGCSGAEPILLVAEQRSSAFSRGRPVGRGSG